MPIAKRRLDICGRRKAWEYLVEAGGRQYRVTARQIGRLDPEFVCTCGTRMSPPAPDESLTGAPCAPPCSHIAEAQRDLNLARQAATQMIP